METEQTGPLVAPAALPTLNAQQLQALLMARKYCYDVTTKFASSNSPRSMPPPEAMMFFQSPQLKQNEPQVVQMVALQEAANKQRALLLMSRWVFDEQVGV